MDSLDHNDQMRSPDMAHGGHHALDDRPQATPYPPAYSDSSLLAFTGTEHALGSPTLTFPPTPDQNALHYALSAEALASVQLQHQHQHHQHDSGKKDIKRRTKTGCMTCRKRRIKCDEAQPECNNCRKSKRTCQGYDPLFKNHPSPLVLQPASSAAKQPATQHQSSNHIAYPAPPAGYVAVQSPTYPIASMSHVPSDTATFDFSAAIDPALQNHSNLPIDHSAGQSNLFAPEQPYQVEVKPSRIDELMQIGAPFPDTSLQPSISDDKRLEIKGLFAYYAPGLNKFLETQWYQQHGWSHVQQTPALLEKYGFLLSRMEFTAEVAPYENQINLTVEACMLWETLQLAKQASQAAKANQSGTSGGGNKQTQDGETRRQPETGSHVSVHETASRLEILRALITNTYLDSSIFEELTAHDKRVPSNMMALQKQLLNRERKFWRSTANFLALNIETSSPDAVDAALLDMRGLLESKENRDIMYSVAVMRVWPRRLLDQENRMRGEGNLNPQIEAEDVKKVDVAKTFLTNQSGGRGTTAASQRLCAMILKGWGPPPFAL